MSIINEKDNLEEDLKNTIVKIIKNNETKLKKEEVEEIVNGIKSELDELVSKHVKKHFKEIAEYIIDKLK